MNILENMDVPSDFEQLKNFYSKMEGLLKEMDDLPNVDDAMQQAAFNKDKDDFKKLYDQNRIDIFSKDGQLKDNIKEGLEEYMKLFYKYGEIWALHRLKLEDEGKVEPQEKKTVSKAQIHQGKMHKVLGVKAGEKIEDKYKTGESLYNALSKRLSDHDKTMKMLNYAANISKEKDIFDAAVRYGKEKK